jgi:hypothetical protein
MTGSNMLDVSSTGVSLALLTSDLALMSETLDYSYNECRIMPGGTDGIKIDGSYMQHSSQIYTGNYGKVFMQVLLNLFIQTSNTSFSPPLEIESAFLTLVNGTEWFIYGMDEDEPEQELQWQFAVIGRMVSNKYDDWHGIDLNLYTILEGTKAWSTASAFEEIVNRIRSSKGINPGPLLGTRFFHTTDYLVWGYRKLLKCFTRLHVSPKGL